MVAASCALINPAGFQTDLMVQEDGGYGFMDFAKVGVPFTNISPLRRGCKRSKLGPDARLTETSAPYAALGKSTVPTEDARHIDRNPASQTQRARRATWGVMPGLSDITITAGPEPAA